MKLAVHRVSNWEIFFVCGTPQEQCHQSEEVENEWILTTCTMFHTLREERVNFTLPEAKVQLVQFLPLPLKSTYYRDSKNRSISGMSQPLNLTIRVAFCLWVKSKQARV